jgi:serine O-acetyltransferase
MAQGFEQLRFLKFEMYLLANRRWWRYWACLFDQGFHAVACYRIDRALYLTLGRVWIGLRLLLKPAFFLFSPWIGSCEIHYQSNIGKGLKILHHSLGLVISKHAVIGEGCTFTGGNCIGSRKGQPTGIRIGDNLTVGANATILGPVTIGNNVTIGAGTVVVRNIADGGVVGGVPARLLMTVSSSGESGEDMHGSDATAEGALGSHARSELTSSATSAGAARVLLFCALAWFGRP